MFTCVAWTWLSFLFVRLRQIPSIAGNG